MRKLTATAALAALALALGACGSSETEKDNPTQVETTLTNAESEYEETQAAIEANNSVAGQIAREEYAAGGGTPLTKEEIEAQGW